MTQPRRCHNQPTPRGRRRPLVAVIFAGVLVLLLGACADDADDAGVDGEQSQEASTTVEDGHERTDPGIDTEAGSGDPFDPTFTPRDCFGHDAPEVECGYVTVPLHHDDPDGETIELALARLPASDPDTDLAPVVLLAGGPGQAILSQLLAAPEVRELLTVGPETIVFDQRGAGYSRPSLACPEVDDLVAQAVVEVDVEASTSALISCGERLAAEGVELEAFTTPANAHDVDLVRRALGLESVNLWGTSYGSLLGQLVAAEHADAVDALVLSSPIDPAVNWMAEAADGFDRALDEVAAACAEDATCSEQLGPFEQRLDQAVAHLAQHGPVEVTVATPDGEELTLSYTPELFASQLFSMFYGSPLVHVLPAVVTAAAEGQLTPMGQLVVLFEEAQQADPPAFGMQLAMLCSGEAADLTVDDLTAGVDRDLLVEHWVPVNPIVGVPVIEVCESWDVPRAYEPEPVDVQVPTLLVTGRFDHVTPATFGEALAGRFPTAHLVEVPTAGHSPLEDLGPCGAEIVTVFLVDPQTRPEASCATERDVTFSPDPIPSGVEP